MSLSLEKTRGELAALADRLAALEKERAGSRQIEAEVPGWARHVTPGDAWGDAAGGPGTAAARAGALRALLDAPSGDPRVTALAMLWLCGLRELEDGRRFEAFLGREASAGRLPSIHLGQAVEPEYPVTWLPMRLADVALAALGRIAGRPFPEEEAYRAWKEANPDPEDTLSYWEGTLRGTDESARRARLGALRKRRPDLFVRIGTMAYLAVEDSELLAAVQGMGADRLLRLLRAEDRWPEFDDGERFGLFCARVLDRAERLFTGPDRAHVRSIWQDPDLRVNRVARKAVVLAMARLFPGERRSILRAAIEEAESARAGSAGLVAELARHHLDEEAEFLISRFVAGSQDVQVALLGEVRAAGPRALPALRAMVLRNDLPPMGPHAAGALVAAGVALGAPDRFPLREDLFPLLSKAARRDPQQGVSAPERERAAVRDCLERVRDWLGAAK